jgi:transcriptional regulator with XRE-family HTH domain
MGNTTKQPFATLLRQERLKRNETQAELAEKVGVSVLTVTRWEQGKNKPYPCYRAKLCALFGKTAEELGLSENEVHAVYLAYAPSDEAYAYRLGQDLETQGFRIWNDQEVTQMPANGTIISSRMPLNVLMTSPNLMDGNVGHQNSQESYKGGFHAYIS